MESGLFSTLIIIILLGTIAGAIWNGLSSANLKNRFAKLGVLTGLTRQQIVDVVGQPNSISSVGENKVLLQWMASGYHISLLFDGDICAGIQHEFIA